VADFKVGDIIDGTVTKLVNFGAFVRVRDGLEGLIHISELSHQRVAHPGDVVHEGQQLKLKIISLDSERHRLGLSLKQAEEPPARPAAEPGQAPAGRSERRGGRQDRGYSMSDAVQEPEGGIDDTLASAFAQVRQQLAAAEGTTPADAEPQADSATAEAEPATAEVETATEPATAEAEAATAEAETAEATTAEAETAEVEPTTSEAEVEPETASAKAETAEPEVAPEVEIEQAAEVPEVTAEAATEATTSADADDTTTAAEPVTESEAAPEAEMPASDTEPEATADELATEDETKT
jgi:small subunit ribosomal protein S1